MSYRPLKFYFCIGQRASITVLALVLGIVATSAQAQTFSVLHNFTGGIDGSTPYAGLYIDTAGNLYGTASGGGTNSVGIVFKMSVKDSQWLLTSLYSFKGYDGDGAVPYARVIRDPNGLVYSSTVAGGGTNDGTIFQLRPSATPPRSAMSPWIEKQLFSFTVGSDGFSPQGDLAFDGAGNLYGTTNAGGTSNIGVVFQLVPTSMGPWIENVIHNFNGVPGDGAYPFAGVTFDSAGNLYGTAYQGGFYNYGTVYELSPSQSGWTETTLYSFTGSSDGGNPTAGVIRDASGNLYGATLYGGIGGGVVFELSPSAGAWTYSVLHAFAGTDGGPQGNLVMDAAGNLYGATLAEGTYGYGNIFKLTPSGEGWIYTDLHDFTGGFDGGRPLDGLVLDPSGDIYGTASIGGSYGHGIVFELTQ
jgi:uncharacterized repeat protein (TIGR03803 family)